MNSKPTLLEERYWDERIRAENNLNTFYSSEADLIFQNAQEYFLFMVESHLEKIGEGHLLDYGCGLGEKSKVFSSKKWKITGIDISGESIKVAQANANINCEYHKMDAHSTSFQEDSFDIVYDFGSFSSLDLKLAVPEIVRILKPGGSLIAFETLGHNFIMNITRNL